MWPFNRGPTKAEWRAEAERLAVELKAATRKRHNDIAAAAAHEARYAQQRELEKAQEEASLYRRELNAIKFNFEQFKREKLGNLPPPVLVEGLPQGHDPRDDLPEDVVELQTRLGQAKTAYAQAMSAYDDLDNDAAKTFEQMGTKLATALNLLTPAGKKKYAKLLAGMGWGDPINYEKDTV
jgi:hypothetical protein